ncbi:hypothetical protein BAnh1_12290 [Bartonella australis AUST/NH1]|uniref:YjiS-like domain-containing protein n=1 Tax=Bartonella australis (strain Aust/NH1) TaxID=1094489 RepID=M1P0C7_BARAA|nr:DUF1127 domain-containing protein [Bartonella australis]AGF75097.1 hypothetical protein BAnh1_12290 [Bartonella australis AUST/NH1]
MNILRSYGRWRRYRRTVSALSNLSVYELKDVGVNRGDINAVAWRSTRKPF